MVPTFTKQSIGQGGAQLYSGSIATATPQAFTMASPPLELNGFGVDPPPGCRALHTGPYPPGWSRLRGYGASDTDSLTLHLLTSLDEPAPSGSTSTARLLGAACHQSPSRRSAAPTLHQAAATAQQRRSLTTSRYTWRLVAHSSAPKKLAARFRISLVIYGREEAVHDVDDTRSEMPGNVLWTGYLRCL